MTDVYSMMFSFVRTRSGNRDSNTRGQLLTSILGVHVHLGYVKPGIGAFLKLCGPDMSYVQKYLMSFPQFDKMFLRDDPKAQSRVSTGF